VKLATSPDTSLKDKTYRKLSPAIGRVQLKIYRKIPRRPHHSLSLKRNATFVLFALLLLPLRFAHADSGIEKQLNFDYMEKVLTLRHFYIGEHLRFHSDGTLNGDGPIGPWTLDGQIEIQKVHLRRGLVVIEARRIHRVFDSQLKPQDQLMAIENNHGKRDNDLEKALRHLKVDIEIELPSEEPDEKAVSSAIHAVFLTDSESMMDIVPSYWRAYFAKQEGKPQSAPQPTGPISRIKPSVVSPPHATYQPDPDYSDEARKAKYQGTAVIYLVIDVSGTTRDLQVQRPLGLGLDEKAVKAVSTWKFEPAQKDGMPVAVSIYVEVNFRLY
jgi:TonB family protein